MGPGGLGLLLGLAHANFGGRTGHAARGCGDCHGDAPDADVAAALEGPPAARPGESVVIRLRVQSADLRHVGVGMNVAASAGRLRPGPGQRLEDGELTHDRRQDMVDGQHSFTLTWTAPAAPGPHTLRAAGNAVDAGGTARGDGWARAAPLSISVHCTPETCPAPDTGGAAIDTGRPAAGSKAEPGCGAGLPAAGGAALLALGLVLGRRRA